jgi:16S rRNA (guanine527-N7)-methyltransferase
VTPEAFAARFDVSRETLASLLAYVALLEKWQRRINLVSSATLPDIWHRHILDSAQLLPHLPAVPASQRLHILDIGSGAGFPGLVLAILGVGDVQLVESNQRKAVFLQTVIRELGLSAHVSNQRIETLPACRPDVITARAFAALPKLMSLTTPHLHNGLTCLFLKGASVDEELTNFQTYSTMVPHLYPSVTNDDGVIVKLTTPQ